MQRLLGKMMIVTGGVVLSLSPVYAVSGESVQEIEMKYITSSVEVSGEAAEYEIKSIMYSDEIFIATIHTEGDQLVGISNKGEALKAGRDYYIRKFNEEDMKVSINTDYLNEQEAGTMQLIFDFASGIRKIVEIELLPMQTEAKLDPLTGTCDCSKERPFVCTLVEFHHNDLLSMTSNGRELVYEEDCTVGRTMDSMYIWFNKRFLEGLPAGENEVVFNFDKTGPIIFTINVINKKTALQLALDKNTAVESNTIGSSLKLTGDGAESYDLSKLKIRYYYTADGDIAQSVAVDNAGINYTQAPWYEGVTNNIQAEIVKMETPAATADTYLELGFTSDAVLNNTATMTIDTRINKSDWSNYDQSNDYSYANADNICIYYNDQLISGVEPN